MIDIESYFTKLEQREDAFRFIYSELKLISSPYIVETGCIRKKDNFKGDGQSTLFWDLICKELNGEFLSVDVDFEAVNLARALTQKGTIVCSDSVTLLRKDINANRIDLLYLDSMDFKGSQESAIHHLCELTAVYWDLKPGCLIAVDDCHSEKHGKHVEVMRFLKAQGIEPLLNDYVTIWEKTLQK